jgi:hypothetical protein
MLIATVQDHYSTIAVLLNLLVFHCTLPLKAIQKKYHLVCAQTKLFPGILIYETVDFMFFRTFKGEKNVKSSPIQLGKFECYANTLPHLSL